MWGRCFATRTATSLTRLSLNSTSRLRPLIHSHHQSNCYRPPIIQFHSSRFNSSKANIPSLAMTARVQHPAPPFKGVAVVNGDFEDISLEDYKGKWLILGFIPLAWTFVCPTEIIAFSDTIEQFNARGASVVFASVDSEYSLAAWSAAARKDGGLGSVKFPLYSDKNHQLAKDYGVLIEDEGVALRGLFIIDPRGIIRQITINDLPVGRSVDETLRLLDAFQFTEQYGDVCPANWNRGQPTINPKESKIYFEQVHGSQ